MEYKKNENDNPIKNGGYKRKFILLFRHKTFF